MMIRTQIQLTEAQAEKAKRLAAERGVSMAEVIRELIDREPEGDDRQPGPSGSPGRSPRSSAVASATARGRPT